MINALRLTEELEKAGFSAEQAKKSVDTWMSLINENFATKSDMREFQLVNKGELREVQVSLQHEIKDLRTDIEGQIKDLRTDLEGQIMRLEAKFDNHTHRIVYQLGALMIGLFTISTSIIAIIISR